MSRVSVTAKRQFELKKNIEEIFGQIKKLKKNKKNNARLKELSEQYEWELRAFTDREEMMPYICERPVAYEKRIYFISRLIQSIINQHL